MLEGRNREYIVSRAIAKYYRHKNEQLRYKQSKWYRMRDLLQKQKYACAYDGRPLTRRNATIDHRIPIIDDGLMNDPDNQVAACSWCNQEKGQMSEADFLLYLKTKQIWNENHPDDKRRDDDLAAFHEHAVWSGQRKEDTECAGQGEQGGSE